MGTILYLIRAVVSLALYGLELMMLIRAVMSFIAPTTGGQFTEFIYNVTEFFISPVRTVMNKFEFVRRCPLDLSFTVTYLIIIIFSSII